MISISLEEANAIRARYPHVCIVRTMKQRSSRHHYWCDESLDAVEMLRRLRKAETAGDGNAVHR